MDTKYLPLERTNLENTSNEFSKGLMENRRKLQADRLEELKTKLADVPKLKYNTDEEFLIRFLVNAKFDLNKAYDRIVTYYKQRKKYSKVFRRCYPSALSQARSVKHFRILPLRAHDRSAIIIHNRGLFDVVKVSFEEMFLLDVMIVDQLLTNPLTLEYGLTVILDAKNVTIKHILHDNPSKLRMLLENFQHAMPLKYKNVHFVNTSILITWLCNIATPFLSEKLRNRIHFHTGKDGWRSLHQFLPPEVLPEEYGGIIKTENVIDLGLTIDGKDELFKKQLQYGFID